MWVPCSHKILKDHTEGNVDGRQNWICSNCGKQGPWTENHSYLGSIECQKCEVAQVDWVACCDDCAKELKNPGRRSTD